ncbi:MAG: putative ABC exporter domain-containing protein [Oscillospiraceae bacterium]|jgi:hypothetical protein|nr:putative ABC exporter domain-containing protein [Oscillospiraceae bacterium]
MNSLAYLLVRSLKNSALELRRKPAKLVLYLLVIAVIAGLFMLSLFTQNEAAAPLDLIWLKGILFAVFLLIFVTSIQKGLSRGDVIFDMSDVNLLFVSPVPPRSILLYGVIRMMKVSFWAGFFLLFQSNSLSMGFGIDFSGLLLILAAFILAVSLMQILSLLVYSTTNGRPSRRMAARLLAIAMFLPMTVHGLWQLVEADGDLLAALASLLRAPVTAWTPVVGWMSEGALAFLTGSAAAGWMFFGLTAAAGAALVVYILLSRPDYYEDVLVASETSYEKKRAMSEGQLNMEAMSNRKFRVAKSGVGGAGAPAIFRKHLRESFRASRFGLWGLSSLLFVAGAALLALFVKESGMLTLLQISMWCQITLIGTGRGLKELYLHYIYLIPESSFSKIVWSNLEIIAKVLVESLLAFGLAGAILGEDPLLVAAAIVVYVLFSLLLLGINYLGMRWTGADISTGLLIMFYYLEVILVMLPGVVLAVVVGTLTAGGPLAGLGVLALWELAAACGCFALSQGILHRCDMPVVKSHLN